jgi:hypothetical protein
MCYCMVCVCTMYACVLIVSYYFPAIESNDECAEEGEVLSIKRRRTRDKPLKASHLYLIHIWILFTYFACFIKVCQTACFYIAIVLVAIICWLKLHKPNCYRPSRWPLWTPIHYSCSSVLLVSIKAFGKPLVEPKTLGWEHSKGIFENVFENLGVAPTPLRCIWKWFLCYWWWEWWKKEMVVFQMTLVITRYPPE